MYSTEKARRITEEARSIDGTAIRSCFPIFDKENEERAKTIVNALEGMTIESAQALLSKVNLYLLQEIIH